MAGNDKKKKNKDLFVNSQIMLGLVMFFFSIVIVLQIRSNMLMKANEQKKQNRERISDIQQQLEEVSMQNEELREKIRELTKEYNSRINALGDEGIEKEIKDLQEKIDKVKIIAGLTDVKGPGVIVKLSDVPDPDFSTYDPMSTIIHSYHVYETVNELRKAGAQAIAINGERILPMSEQMCAGATIRVNRKRYAYPYIITAIGDKEALYNHINNSDIYVNLKLNSFDVSLAKEDEIIIPKYSGDINSLINMLEGVELNENRNKEQNG